MNTPWVLGIDPGFGMTGLVLRREDARDVVAWATYTLPRENAPELQMLRSVSLAQAIVDCVAEWIAEYDVRVLEVCIEQPIYNHNAKILMLQCRLFEDIERGLAEAIEPVLDQLWFTEVNPMRSKLLLAHDGSANKRAMIAASPFVEAAHPQDVKEALADAFAHSLAGGTRQYDVSGMQLTIVQATAAGKGEPK